MKKTNSFVVFKSLVISEIRLRIFLYEKRLETLRRSGGFSTTNRSDVCNVLHRLLRGERELIFCVIKKYCLVEVDFFKYSSSV